MRRHILLAEHYRLMCLLLENRENAIFSRFTPLIAHMVPNLSHQDIAVLQNADINYAAEMPLPQGGTKQVNYKVLVSQTPAVVQAFDDAQRQVRANAIAHAIIMLVWTADPNPKKAYTTWMLTRFAAAKHTDHQLKLEDLERTRGYLELFDQVKARLPQELRDINRFKNTNDLFDAIKDYRQDAGGEIVNQSQEQQMLGEAEVIYDSPQWRILIPKTQQASCYFGRGTEWCTAWVPPKTNNMFDRYNNQGPMYIVTEKSTGTRWQFHPPSAQYMDESDRAINIAQWLRDHPEVDQFFNKYFDVKPLEALAPFDEKRNYYLSRTGDPEKPDGYTMWVADDGFQPGGLVRTKAMFEIAADGDKLVRGCNCDNGLGDDKRPGFIQMLDKLGFHGDCRWMRDNDVIWEDGRYNGFHDLPIIETLTLNKDRFGDSGDVQVRKVGKDRDFTLHFTYAENGLLTDDVAEIDNTMNDFKFKQNSRRFSIDDGDDLANLIVRMVIEHVPENSHFDRPNSEARLPRAEILVEKRPQWADIGYLYSKVGDTEMVRDRVVDWLNAENYSEKHKVVAVDNIHVITLENYKDIHALIEDEGDDSAKWVSKLVAGDERMDFNHSPDISYHKTDLLKSLDEKTFKRLCAFLADEYADDLEDIGLEGVTDADDIETLMDEGYAEEVTSAMETAVLIGEENGAEHEAYEALVSTVEKCPHLMFFREGKPPHMAQDEPGLQYDTPVSVVATVKDLLVGTICEVDDVEGNDLFKDGGWLEALETPFEIQQPYYGWSGYDDSSAAERFGEDVHEFLPTEDETEN